MTERKDGTKRVLTLRQEKFTADGSADSMSRLLHDCVFLCLRFMTVLPFISAAYA